MCAWRHRPPPPQPRLLNEVESVIVERVYRRDDPRSDENNRERNRQTYEVRREDTFRDLISAFRHRENLEDDSSAVVYMYTTVPEVEEIHTTLNVFDKINPCADTTIFLASVGCSHCFVKRPVSQWNNTAAVA